MKKLLMLMLCMLVCFQLVACKNETEEKKEEAKRISDEITSGEFIIDGDVYRFPMELQDMLDKGWEISNEYYNIDTFELDENEYSEEFTIWKGDDISAKVAVINKTSEKQTVHNCMLIYLEIDTDDAGIVLPGGITKDSKEEDIEDTYGAADSKNEEYSNTNYVYDFESKDGYVCQVIITALPRIDYEIGTVTYLMPTITGELSNEDYCRLFIDSAMKASFYNDSTEYVANLYDTEENAQILYESEVEYYTEFLFWYIDTYQEYLTDDIYEEYYEISEKVLSKVKWEIVEIDVDEDEYEGEVTLKLYPTNYLSLIDEKIDEAIAEYLEIYGELDLDTLTVEERTEVECNYASIVLEKIRGIENQIEVVDPVVKTYEISEYILTDEQWGEIDDIIMGITE